MSQKILQINSRLRVSAAEFEQDNGAESAQALVDVPGLLWKIAYISIQGEPGYQVLLLRQPVAYQGAFAKASSRDKQRHWSGQGLVKLGKQPLPWRQP
jgi:hypothetical protein